MPAYSGSPGSSKSIHYGGGSTYHPRTRRVTVPHGAPAPPAPTGGSVSHGPRHSINRGVVAVRSPSGTVTHYARQTPGISPKQARKRARVAQQRAATVAHSRAALKKAAILHHIAHHLTKQAHAELAKAPPHIAIAAAKKVAPKAVAKALQNVKQPKAPAQQKAPAQPKIKLQKLPVNEQMAVILRRHGLNKVGAAGVAGNALQESSYNPTAGSSAAGGLLGFTAGDKSMAALQAYAAAHGKDPTKTPTQTKFALTTIPPSLKSELNRSGSPEKAASIFMSQWEAPYVPTENEARRQAGARQTYEATKNLKVKGKIVGGLASPEKALTGKSLTHFQAIKREAARIDKFHLPYELGGGHQASPAPGPRKTNYDCSGVVSRVLQRGGYNVPTQVSGAYMNWGKPGPGAVTIYANPEHVFMRIGNRFFGTSSSNPGGGAGWVKASTYSQSYLSTFTVRHPTGLGKEAGFVAPAGGTGLTDLGGGTSVGMTSGVHLASPGSSSSPILPQNVSAGQKGQAKTQSQTNAQKARRQVLQGAIAALGKTPPKPKAVPLTSANTTTALRQRKTVIAGA